jgi:hypothetical protein
MQVSVLKLGAGIGRSLEKGATLESQNEQLRASVASLADEQRIESLAAGMGMVMPPPQSVGFLSAQPGGASQAVADIKAPDAAAFLSALQTAIGSTGATTILAPGTTSGAGTGTTGPGTTSAAATSTASSTTATQLASAGAGSSGTGTGSSSAGGASGGGGSPSSAGGAAATSTSSSPTAASATSSSPAVSAGSGSGGTGQSQSRGGTQAQGGGVAPPTPGG